MLNKEKSIRKRLIMLITIISSLSLLVATSVLFIYEIYSYRQNTARQLEIIGTMLAQNCSAALAFDSEEEATDVLSSLKAEKNIMGAAIYRQDGTLFVESIIQPGNHSIPRIAPAAKVRGDDYLEVLVPITQGDKTLGTLYIKRGTQDITERITLYFSAVFVILGLCFGLSYILSRRFERSISDPIISLAVTARQISNEHDYSVRASTAADGEIGTLTTAFNLMLSRIEEQNNQIQRHAQQLESKVAERTLEIKRQRDFAETVINNSLVLIAVFDTEARFIGFNKRSEVEFGMKVEDVIGKRFGEVMPQAIGSPSYKAVVRALNGELVHYEKYKSPVTNEFYESYAIPLRNEQNEVYAAILTAHNITATVTANEKLLHGNEELKRKNIELEQFAYVASHDLQEPLRKIQMFADLSRRARAEGKEIPDKYLEKIEASAQRMSSLIRDVLEYSKLARVEESFIDTDLNQILENVKTDFELLISEKKSVIEHEKLPIIKGNQLQLHQLFANLLNNAMKFSERAPIIKITVQQVQDEELERLPSLDKRKSYCKILFSDNGIGFEPQHAEKVFSIFQRLNTREKYEGTGIGLALCKKIAENHHGHISVESVPGVGTTFSVILPVQL